MACRCEGHCLPCVYVRVATCVCACVQSVVTHRIVLRCADQHILVAPDGPDGSLVSKEGTLTLARVQVPNLSEHRRESDQCL